MSFDPTQHKVLSESEVREWIDYYMEGNELEDDVQQQVLAMALRYATQKPISVADTLFPAAG